MLQHRHLKTGGPALRETLLSFLACPKCGSADLVVHDAVHSDGHIMEGVLDCSGCARVYPIRGGVPRLLAGPLNEEKNATAKGFGYAWNRFNFLTPDYEEQFRSWLKPIEPEFFEGKTVLDLGCGKGRHLVLSQQFGAREVVGVDLSDAVDAAFANTRHLPNVHVVQGDIYEVPMQPVFDYGYSIGVLHHLPDPEAGFHQLVSKVAPGGTVSAWVYGRENNGWIIYGINPLRTRLTSRLDLPVLQRLSAALALPLYAYARGVAAPLSQGPAPLQKLVFYRDYLQYLGQFSFREVHSIVFDHLLAPTAFYLRKEEFEGWFERAGLEDVTISWRFQNSWRGCGRRPLSGE